MGQGHGPLWRSRQLEERGRHSPSIGDESFVDSVQRPLSETPGSVPAAIFIYLSTRVKHMLLGLYLVCRLGSTFKTLRGVFVRRPLQPRQVPKVFFLAWERGCGK